MRDATWDIDMHANSGAVATISWIEMFKVVNGVITDVWRPNAVAAPVSRRSLAGVREVGARRERVLLDPETSRRALLA